LHPEHRLLLTYRLDETGSGSKMITESVSNILLMDSKKLQCVDNDNARLPCKFWEVTCSISCVPPFVANPSQSIRFHLSSPRVMPRIRALCPASMPFRLVVNPDVTSRWQLMPLRNICHPHWWPLRLIKLSWARLRASLYSACWRKQVEHER